MARTKRNIHGVILLDKPTGLSSNAAMQKLRRHFEAKKAGHTGSLDPLATGLLPICFGQATKVCEYFLSSTKRYTAHIRFGQRTDTYDSEGEIVEERPVNLTDEQIDSTLEEFRGEILQVPPMYSALKKDGQPLYKMARRGEEIERPARPMTVYELSWKRLTDKEIEVDVRCSGGFYVRSLAHDLGQRLGCGAHLNYLRRTEVKAITLTNAYTLEELLNSDLSDVLLPIDSLLKHLPALQLQQVECERLLMGQTVHGEYAPSQEPHRLYWPDGRIFGVGSIAENRQVLTEKQFILDQS